MGWSDWRKIAEANDRSASADVAHDGPATYELALRRPRGGDITIVYVGETLNERARILDYVRGDTALEARIVDALQQGWALSYRAMAQSSLEEAQAFRDSLLVKYGYPWNQG